MNISLEEQIEYMEMLVFGDRPEPASNHNDTKYWEAILATLEAARDSRNAVVPPEYKGTKR
jgi:hypothetical protein